MKNLFTNIITIQDFKEYQSGWSENFEDNQIQDAINIATNDLNAYTNFLLEKVYVYNTGEDVKQNNPLWRNELEMKALKMSVLSQTYYKLMNGNDNSIGDASYSGSGISMSQSLPERNYISEDVLQWLVNARLMENNNHKHYCEDFIECKEISMNPLELAKKPYPDPTYVPSKFINFTPFNLLQINQNGYVVQSTVDEVMKNWTIPEYLITYIEEYVLGVLGDDIEELKKQVKVINQNITNLDNNKTNTNLSNVNVGSGKEDKLLSFDTNGNLKFIDQVQPTPSGVVFEKEIELTNAYNGTSTNEIGTKLYRVDGVEWNRDQDLVNYFDGNYKFILQYVGNYVIAPGNIKLSGIESSISANRAVESNTRVKDIPIYNLCFLTSYDKRYLISLENNINIYINSNIIDFTNWFHTIYGIKTLILVSSTNGSHTTSRPETYKFILKVVKI